MLALGLQPYRHGVATWFNTAKRSWLPGAGSLRKTATLPIAHAFPRHSADVTDLANAARRADGRVRHDHIMPLATAAGSLFKPDQRTTLV